MPGVAGVSAQIVETLEQIKKGNIPEGYIGYRQLAAAKCGLTEAKCRNPLTLTDSHRYVHEF
nr:hypothetical protein [Salmonella sp.]